MLNFSFVQRSAFRLIISENSLSILAIPSRPGIESLENSIKISMSLSSVNLSVNTEPKNKSFFIPFLYKKPIYGSDLCIPKVGS
jgi:hypothetical protein